MSLFIKKDIKLHSGGKSDYKIECDSLTDEDLETFAYLFSKRFTYQAVYGIPSGGIRFADKLRRYCIDAPHLPMLIADDVITTGNSMEQAKEYYEEHDFWVIGVVIFNRSRIQLPEWIIPILDLNEEFK